MNKIVIFSLTGFFIISIGLNHDFIKPNNVIEYNWLKTTIYQEKNLTKNNVYLYNDNNIKINLINNQSNQTIAKIYAKKPQKIYYLSLKNNKYYNHNQLTNYIKTKFYRNQTSEHFIPSERFFSFVDTKDYNGEITKNGTIWFRSSWGVYNNQKVDSSIQFNLKENTIKEFIFLHNQNNLPKNVRLQNIQVEIIKPKKIGLLPIVQIHQPPIRNATWTTNEISFNDLNNYKKYSNNTQDLAMPEGHDSGLKWWKGITSSIGPIVAIVSGGIGSIIAFKSIIATILTGALVTGTLQIIATLIDKLSEASLKDGITVVKKIYDEIMKNPINISPNKINLNNLKHPYLSTFIDGKLWAEANATSIWRITSKMDLNAVWGAINSDVSYRIYN